MINGNCKAQECVNDVKSQISKAEAELKQAKMKAEKSSNKAVIDDAISSLQNACDCLCKFQD